MWRFYSNLRNCRPIRRSWPPNRTFEILSEHDLIHGVAVYLGGGGGVGLGCKTNKWEFVNK
jgi:hypothetical protein